MKKQKEFKKKKFTLVNWMSYKYICPLDVSWYKMLLNKSSQKSILFLKKFTTKKAIVLQRKPISLRWTQILSQWICEMQRKILLWRTKCNMVHFYNIKHWTLLFTTVKSITIDKLKKENTPDKMKQKAFPSQPPPNPSF